MLRRTGLVTDLVVQARIAPRTRGREGAVIGTGVRRHSPCGRYRATALALDPTRVHL